VEDEECETLVIYLPPLAKKSEEENEHKTMAVWCT
jgi:hypothetical protein